MARVTLGGVIASISGSVGSACFRNSPSGTVLYNRPLPSQRGSTDQHTNRSILKAAAAAWSLLDDDIRTAWGSLAKQEYIPSFFSRGRRWTGRQLFTCFYFYAETQRTPLPARWLPTPPLFFSSPWFMAYLFYPRWIEALPADPPGTVDHWESLSQFSLWRPTSLNPADPGGLLDDFPVIVYCGLSAIGATSPPRSMGLLAPPYGPYRQTPPVPPYLPGIQSVYYADRLFSELFGFPPSLSYPMSSPVTRPFDLWVSMLGITDERMYFTGLLNVGSSYYLTPWEPQSTQESTWICNPPYWEVAMSYINDIAYTYPKTEV